MATEFTKEQIAGKRDIKKWSCCDFLPKKTLQFRSEFCNFQTKLVLFFFQN